MRLSENVVYPNHSHWILGQLWKLDLVQAIIYRLITRKKKLSFSPHGIIINVVMAKLTFREINIHLPTEFSHTQGQISMFFFGASAAKGWRSYFLPQQLV